jgi:hypothetical protein
MGNICNIYTQSVLPELTGNTTILETSIQLRNLKLEDKFYLSIRSVGPKFLCRNNITHN